MQQHLEQQHSPTEPFDPTTLNRGMEEISLSIAHLQKSVADGIVSVRQELIAEIEAQHTSVLSRLEALEAIDSSLLASAIAQLKTDLPALEHNTTEAIGQLTNKLGSLALRLDNLPTLLEPVGLSGIEGAITLLSSENANLNCQLIHLTQQFNTRPEATEVQRLGKMIALAIQRLDELEQRQQNLGEISEIQQQLKDLDASTANLHNYAQQLKHNLEGQINQLHLVTSALDERSQMLIEIPQQLDEIKQLNAGLDERTTTLDERIKTLTQMEQQAKTVQQSIAVLHEKVEHLLKFAPDRDDIQQQLASLWELTNESIKAVDLESKLVGLSEASATKHELDALTQLFIQEIEQLNCAIANLRSPTPQFDPLPLTAQIANLAERVDKLPFLQQQLAEVHKSIEDLDTSQEALHDRTRNLDQMQSHLENLQRSLTEYVKMESLKDILSRLYQEFSNRVDVTVEEQTTKLNHLLRETQTNYKYELVFDRCGSRNVLLEALQQAEHRLILVCPWLTVKGADYQVLHKCRALLEQGVQLDIGWGHLKDIDDDKLGTGFFYNALNNFKKLAVEYPNLCNLKLLGTHEKFLVCDRSFAMLGSHNFLTSGNHSNERELGLLTNDTRIIADLIGRFDNARNLKSTSWIE